MVKVDRKGSVLNHNAVAPESRVSSLEADIKIESLGGRPVQVRRKDHKLEVRFGSVRMKGKVSFVELEWGSVKTSDAKREEESTYYKVWCHRQKDDR